MTLLWVQRLCLFSTSVVFGYDFALGASAQPFCDLLGFSALTLLWEQRLCLFSTVVFGFDFAVVAPAMPLTLEALVFMRGKSLYVFVS